MAGRISQQVIEQIHNRVNIVELIGSQVKLKRTGHNYTGLCPFHSDGSPSFSVNPEKGFYYCFGCHESGDVIGFIRKSRGMSYVEAVELLAGQAGIELAFEEGQRGDWDRARERRRSLVEVNRAAHTHFRTALFAPQGAAALAYLTRRGLDREVLDRFQVGFLPSGTTLYDSFVARGTPLNLAEELGLIVKSRRGNFVDRLGGRVLFPVFALTDELCGFSGRALPDGPDPKYLNSPESEIFRKGDLLFGLVQGRERIKKDNLCILVEGQIDAIALHQAGFPVAVAPMGTALTESQAAAIRRFTENVVLLFDGDEAGRKATWRSMPLVMNRGLYGRVASVPAGEDPDSLLRAKGPEAISELVARARPFLEFAVSTLAEAAGKDLHGKALAARKGMEFAAQIENAIDRQIFVERLAAELAVSVAALRAEATISRQADAAAPAPAPAEPLSAAERELVKCVFLRPDLVRQICHGDSFDLVGSAAARTFFTQVLADLEESGSCDRQAALARLEDPALKDLCASLLLDDGGLGPGAVEEAQRQVLVSMRRGALRRSIDELRRRARKAESGGDLQAALALMGQQEKAEKSLRELMAGGDR